MTIFGPKGSTEFQSHRAQTDLREKVNEKQFPVEVLVDCEDFAGNQVWDPGPRLTPGPRVTSGGELLRPVRSMRRRGGGIGVSTRLLGP